jgi:hypothetical protein
MVMGGKMKLPVFVLSILAALLLLIAPPTRAQSLTILWTATGDDSTVGRATSDSLRYSRTAVGADTLAWWNAAFVVPGMPVPSSAGATDSVKVALGAWNQVYYFVLKVCDEVPNCSGWSNVAVAKTPALADVWPPGRVKDVRGR